MPQHHPIPFAHFFCCSWSFFVELVDSKSARHLFESCHDGIGEKIKENYIQKDIALQKLFFSMIAQNFCHFTSRNIKDNVGIIICIIINLNFCTFCSIPLQFWFLNTIMQNFGLSTNCKRKIYLWDGAMHKIFEITHPFPRELLMFAETMICILSAKYSFLFHHIQNMTAYLRLNIYKKLESIII